MAQAHLTGWPQGLTAARSTWRNSDYLFSYCARCLLQIGLKAAMFAAYPMHYPSLCSELPVLGILEKYQKQKDEVLHVTTSSFRLWLHLVISSCSPTKGSAKIQTECV